MSRWKCTRLQGNIDPRILSANIESKLSSISQPNAAARRRATEREFNDEKGNDVATVAAIASKQVLLSRPSREDLSSVVDETEVCVAF